MGGCMSSAAGGPSAEATSRRRLSVDYVEGTNEHDKVEISDDDRGLIQSLNNKSLFDLVDTVEKATGQATGRKFSTGSTTDQEAKKKESFGDKATEATGDKTLQASHKLGFACKKGLKPESPNQDSWFMLTIEEAYSIYAVFDGHGQTGHDVSEFVKNTLIALIVKDRRFRTDDSADMLRDCFKKCQSLVNISTQQKKLNATMSGTTATVAIHDHKKKNLVIAHVGDSSAVLMKQNPAQGPKMLAKLLTREHKPGLSDEKARIEKAGGNVVFDGYANHRVYAKGARYPGLNMSRCIGDLLGHIKCGITADPEVTEFTISDEDRILLLCSDGVWEFNTPQEAADIVAKFPPHEPMEAAECLARKSWDNWIKEEGGEVVDDITALVIHLHPEASQA